MSQKSIYDDCKILPFEVAQKRDKNKIFRISFFFLDVECCSRLMESVQSQFFQCSIETRD